MNATFAKKYLPLIIALAEGKTIQMNYGTLREPEWNDVPHPNFGMDVEYYRIKPEPKVRYGVVYPDGDCDPYYNLENIKKSLGTYKAWAAIIKISVCPDTYETTIEVVEKNAPR